MVEGVCAVLQSCAHVSSATCSQETGPHETQSVTSPNVSTKNDGIPTPAAVFTALRRAALPTQLHATSLKAMNNVTQAPTCIRRSMLVISAGRAKRRDPPAGAEMAAAAAASVEQLPTALPSSPLSVPQLLSSSSVS